MRIDKAMMMLKNLSKYYIKHTYFCYVHNINRNIAGTTRRRVLNTGKIEFSVIRLNKYYVENNNEDHVLHTILHEIAHALDSVKGHGDSWKMIAQEVELGTTNPAHPSVINNIEYTSIQHLIKEGI